MVGSALSSPSPVSGSRRARVFRHVQDSSEEPDILGEVKPKPTKDELEDSEGEGEEDDVPAKRRRVSETHDEEEEEQVSLPCPKLHRDTDNYVAGSIVRIKLENFLAYDAVEFRPGPYLNMIIGPNGAGKSTIVCAIALGLAFPMNVVSRAKQISGYVKRDKDKGNIEIELKGKAGEPNMTIGRAITRDNDSSIFTVNGRRVTMKEVVANVHSLNVQVDNLCSFLPQEKVSEFAKMNPATLLKQTEKAAGDPSLTAWHEDLITKKKRLDSVTENLKNRESELNAYKDSAEKMERDVQRFKEREAIERELAIIEVQLPYCKYAKTKAEYETLRAEKNKLVEELKQAEERNAPFMKAKEKISDQIHDLDKLNKKGMDDIARARNDSNTKSRECQAAETRYEGHREALDGVETREALRLDRISQAKNKLEETQAFVNRGPPPEADVSRITAEVGRLNADLRGMRDEMVELQDGQRKIHREKQNSVSEAKRLRDSLDSIQDVKKQREEAMKKSGKSGEDVWRAVQWIRANRDKFKDVVYEPIQLVVNIRDKRYARHVENIIADHILNTIVCKSADDYRMMQEVFQTLPNGRRSRENPEGVGIRVNIADLDEGCVIDNYPPTFSPEELLEMHFECMALSQIDAPEDILAFLCKQSNVHRVPMTADSRARPDVSALERPDSGIRRFATGDLMTTFGFSAHGSKNVYSQTKILGPGKIFEMSADLERKQRLEKELTACEEQIKKFEDRMRPLTEQENAIRERERTTAEAKAQLMGEKTKAQKASNDFRTAKEKIIILQNTIKRFESEPDAEAQRQAIKRNLDKDCQLLIRCANQNKALLVRRAELLKTRTKVIIRQAQAQIDLMALDAAVDERGMALAELREATTNATGLVKAKAVEARNIFTEAQVLLEKCPADVQAEFQRRREEEPDLSIRELEQRAEGERQRLDATAHVAASVIETYRQRLAQVERAKADVTLLESQSETLSTDIITLRKHWENGLNNMVMGISECFKRSFDEMGLSGEVKVAKDEEDYDKWGINILVSFREDDDMQVLTGTRQSGGERALSTITYLMALTQVTKTPFTVVDEINQGMDGTAERAVHDQLVRTTCDKEAGQYWLVTPKLLSGLTYHPRMKVMCVNNGDWLPDTFPAKEYLRRKAKLMRSGNDDMMGSPIAVR